MDCPDGLGLGSPSDSGKIFHMAKQKPGASRPLSLTGAEIFNGVGTFPCIAAEPPWDFKSNSAALPGRNARRHYPTMSLKEIAALPVGDHAADNAVLFLWITGPLLAIGAHLPIMKAWRFKPSGMGFVWIKLNPSAASLFILKTDLATGGGFTTRKNAEFCLIGKRGRSVRRDAGHSSRAARAAGIAQYSQGVPLHRV